MQYCPRGNCWGVATEMVSDIPFCARHATEERAAIENRPARPDPFGLAYAQVALTRYLPEVRATVNEWDRPQILFNAGGEPTRLLIGGRRYRVYPE